MGFGTELWDQVPAVEQFGQDGNHFNTTMADFFERLSKDASRQSKDLIKIVDTCMPTSAKKQPRRMDETGLRTTLLSAWMRVIHEKQATADKYAEFSLALDREVTDNLRAITREKDVQRTRLLDDVKRMRDEMQTQYKRLDEARVHYEKKAQKSVDARRHFERVERNLTTNRSELDKVRGTSERRQSKASAAEQAYRRAILETNERQRRYFHQDMCEVLDNLQLLEADRIDKTKTILHEFIMAELALNTNIRTSLERMTQTVNQIDQERDINTFIAENRTGEPVPDDISFLPYNPSLGRAPAYGSGGASTTRAGLLGKKELQTTDLANMPVDRQVKVLESKIKELQLQKIDIERRKVDTELRVSDIGPTETYQQEQLRSTMDQYNRNIGILQDDIDRYEDIKYRIQRGESIEPRPMTGVNIPTTPTVSGVSYFAIESAESPQMPSVINPELRNPTNMLPPGTEEQNGMGNGKQRGIVDRVLGSIFHPREP